MTEIFKKQLKRKKKFWDKKVSFKKIERFKCPDCEQLHETFEDANECCEKEIESLECFECLRCGSVYENEGEAEECFKECSK